jgi:hypothetical protein
LAAVVEDVDVREVARESGISHVTIYRLIDIAGEPDYEPKRETWGRLKAYLATRRGITNSSGHLRNVREDQASQHAPGPSVTKFGPRAQDIILQYLRRLGAAGLGTEELIQMEHLLADRSFAQRFSTSRGGPLTEDEEIILIEATWRAIADTLALRGIRP